MPRRIFLLSPASTRGTRASQLLGERASFPLARRLRHEGVELGELYSFLSGLYFRGKLAYARTFAGPEDSRSGGGLVRVITPGAGLLPTDTRVTLADLAALARIEVSAADRRFRLPLQRSARALASEREQDSAVLLGSVATDKYVEILLAAFGRRLLFPPSFIGRGDLSRGGLLLRCAAAGHELDYVPVQGAVRHGPRPPRLPRGG